MNLDEKIQEALGKGVIEHAFFIMAYFDEDGQSKWAYISLGDPLVSQTLGLLSVAQHVLGEMVTEGKL